MVSASLLGTAFQRRMLAVTMNGSAFQTVVVSLATVMVGMAFQRQMRMSTKSIMSSNKGKNPTNSKEE